MDVALKIQTSVASSDPAGVWIDNGDNYRLVVELVEGTPTTDAEALLSAAGAPGAANATRTVSLSELTKAVSDTTSQWQGQIRSLNGVGIDDTTGQIVFYVDGSSTARGSVDAAELTSFPAVVEYDSSGAGDAMYGGLNLTSCTAGFTARNYSTGAKGYFTAAHSGTQNYQYPFGGTTSYSSSYLAQRYDGYADIQFRSFSSHTPKGYFYGSSTSALTTQINGGYAAVGTYMCHRGKTTGYQCGSVTSITHAPTWANACNGATCQPVWVRSSAYQMHGDSGGPWFRDGNLATGIHKGGGTDGSFSVSAKLDYSPGSTTVCTTSTCP